MNPIAMPPLDLAHKLILITGPSGAGRSTAINALEDMGFEAIDNLPLSLVPRLLAVAPLDHPMALGIDARNREFSSDALINLIEEMSAHPGVSFQLVYVDCAPDVLLRRFSETRRRHPLAPAEGPEAGIAREIDLLSAIRTRADILIDTTEFTPHDLRAEMDRWFAPDAERSLAISLHSFSYKRGLPRGIDTVFDVRFLRNPYWHPPLRALDGRDPAVAAYIADDPRFEPFFSQLRALVSLLLPAYTEEGKAHLAIGLGCTGGQHRSVAVTEKLGKALAEEGWQVSTRHRELERRAADTSARSPDRMEKP
ncbi:UPF0042 nucleotide-binding protein [Poseidonocella pacifica]|uniref:UPF0042 nucleotide-binding protein n=1 Tax=Poseidonocella pacifica TaxID=871651 RepID=A0A1I0YIX3_9RHOB|nr:RNase adapter RapZ [Poseidonocella pacifica]SFB13112.1 UPF0042 nucleotide-binding protein [Poseidonocella pacifica]